MDDNEDDDQFLRVLDTIIFVGWRLLAGFVITAVLILVLT